MDMQKPQQRPEYDRAPFQRGTGEWQGIVMIIRPDPSKVMVTDDTQCKVVSPRRLQYNGLRAIATHLPYGLFRQTYFSTDDGDNVCVYAELKGEHLEFFEKANVTEFFRFDEA